MFTKESDFMTPVSFPESNCKFGPPVDLTEGQCRTIPAFSGTAQNGSVDGYPVVIVAWKLDYNDIALLMKNDGVIFLSMCGGLAPHYLSHNFHDATHPA
jgi:hypothetical protein